MTKNWEVFDRDPRGWTIPNDGVAKVVRPTDQKEWDVLRWELSSFLCEGEYAEGLERILSSFLSNLGQPSQPAVWVSGFYGSGKSHMVRVLARLWSDEALPDGATPRGIAHLTPGVIAQLRELSAAGARHGGLWSAAGKLGSGVKANYRLAFLSVLLTAAGLPGEYPAGRLAMMLRREGAFDQVTAQLRAQGRDPSYELLQLWSSQALGKAVVEALPGFASDQKEARDIFRAQYPPQQADISDEETIAVMRELLELQSNRPGDIPCTVIALDELQTYIGDDKERRDNVENITELCSASFGSKVMIVGTGQMALQVGGLLAKMQHRFSVRVQLSDRDVEQVTRAVVLRKKPQKRQAVDQALEAVSGEISSHLKATRIGPKPTDAGDLVPDYPILPVRRRFWEQALRAIDRGGGSGQLRTQLRVTHEANQLVAEGGIGTVVGADFIYANQADAMVSAKVLSQETYQRIKEYEQKPDDGTLKARILGLVFLISQLPRDAGADIGVRARPDMLSQLLVSELKTGSEQLKPRVTEALTQLEHDGAVVDVDGEYRLQTPEGGRLLQLHLDRLGQIRNDASRMAQERDGELRNAVQKAVGNLKVNQGASKTPRRVDISFGEDAPDTTGKDIPAWVRDEWSVSLPSFRSAAQRAGTGDPTVFVLLPKLQPDRLRDLIAAYHAASEVLQTVAMPETPEGIEARSGLETRERSSRTQLDQLLGEILGAARVWQAGGTEVAEGALPASVHKAAEASLHRKFPRFKDADHPLPHWGLVLNRAKEGNANPLEVIGYQGEVSEQPVCKAILAFLASGKKGTEVRAHFGAGEYGWPDDAINGALLTLVAAGLARAQDRAGRPVSVGDIRQPDINATTFIPETVVITAAEKIAVRRLLAELGISVGPGQEPEGVARLLQNLANLAERAGGEAPLPPPPDTSLVRELQQLSGNRLLKRALEERVPLESTHKEWSELVALVSPRSAEWETLQRLLGHAAGLQVANEVASEAQAILEARQLLTNPDPVLPLVTKLTDDLRTRVQAAHAEFAEAMASAIGQVRALAEWSVVGDSEGQRVLARAGLAAPSTPALPTPEAVLTALDATPLSTWENRRDAIPVRIARAQADLAALAQPQVQVVSVPLPKRILKSADDIDTYVEEIRHLLHAKLTDNTHLSL